MRDGHRRKRAVERKGLTHLEAVPMTATAIARIAGRVTAPTMLRIAGSVT
jgi:hypothetical protein